MTITSGTNSTVSKTISGTVTIQNNMQLGFSGDASGYGSNMAVWNVNSSSAYPANGNVTVNYVDANGNTIASPSTINAKTGDVIGVTNGSTFNTLDTYDYTAPKIAGYTYSKSSSSVPVTAYNASTQTITVTYTANTQNSYWTYAWANNTYGATPPNTTTLSVPGTTGATIKPPTISTPAGYHVALIRSNGKYYYYSGSIASTVPSGAVDIATLTPPSTSPYAGSKYPNTLAGLEQAVIDSMGGSYVNDVDSSGNLTNQTPPNFNTNGSSVSKNNFDIMLEANKENGTLTYKNGGTVLSNPAQYAFNGGYGDYVGLSVADKTTTVTTDTKFAVATPANSKVKSITAPNGTAYIGYQSFVAPTSTAAGSVTLVKADNTTTTVTLPYVAKGSGTITYPSMTDSSVASATSDAQWTELLRVLGYAFPYGESGAANTNNNNFVVNIVSQQKLDFAVSYASGTPGTGTTAGSLYGSYAGVSGSLTGYTGDNLPGWSSYYQAVNSAASALGTQNIFTANGGSVAGYSTSLAVGSSLVGGATSSYYSAAVSAAGSVYTSVLDSTGNETDQNINVVLTPQKQLLQVNITGTPNSGSFKDVSFYNSANAIGTSSLPYANGTGAPITAANGTFTTSGATSTGSLGSGFAANYPANYSYADNANVSTGHYSTITYSGNTSSAATSYTTLASAMAANPYLDTNINNIQDFEVSYAADGTSIYANGDQTGTATQAWTPLLGVKSVSEYHGYNIDLIDNPDGYNVNGSPIMANIVDSSGQSVYNGAATDPVALNPGKYTVTYTVLDHAGKKITASTTLTISSYDLPYAGGNGVLAVAGAAIVAFFTGMGACVTGKKHRSEDEN